MKSAQEKVRVMVVDDTITYRRIMSSAVEQIQSAELVGTATSGKTALGKLASLKPHLIFLDVIMPEMDGIETLRQIKAIAPKIHVVMVSSVDIANAKATLNSLENGALDFVAKPVSKDLRSSIKMLKRSLEPLVDVVLHDVVLKGGKSGKAKSISGVSSSFAAGTAITGKVDFVLIGVSTGGPVALQNLFESIQVKLACPIFVVQHMPPMFTRSLAERLNAKSPMEITEAHDCQEPEKGRVYFAPGGKHMEVYQEADGGYKIRIVDYPPVNHCKPSVDILFKSVAMLERVNAIAVILTGMGRDGTEGMHLLKKKDTYCLIQDEPTSVVWGMPGSIYKASLADEVLPLGKIGERLMTLIESRIQSGSQRESN